MQQQPATPPPTLNVQLPTPSGFSAHRARSQTVNDTERPDEIKVHGRSPSLNTASALQDVITQGPKSARRAAPPTPLALSKQHTPSALLSPYDSPRAGKHTPRHSISGVLPSAGLRHEAARQRGLSIAVVKHGENQVVMTPGLSSGALKSASLKSAGIVPIQSAKPGQVSAPPSARKEIILCKYYHTPGLTCTSRPCRFVHDLTQQQNSSSPMTSPSLYSMLSPNAVLTPTAGTFALAQATEPIKDGKDEEIINIGETVLVHDEKGDEVVGEVFVMSGGGAGLAGRANKKFKTEQCRDFVANGSCPYGDYCSFLHGDETPDSKASRPNRPKERIPLSEKRERSAPGFSAWLAKIPKSVYDPKPGAQWSADDDEAAPEPVKNVLTPKSVNAPPFEPPSKLSKAVSAKPFAPASRPKALDLSLRKQVSDKALSHVPDSAIKSSTVEPPDSAFATDSDPATPWDPALRYEREQHAEDEAEAAAVAVAHAGMDDHMPHETDESLDDMAHEPADESQDFTPAESQDYVPSQPQSFVSFSEQSWTGPLMPPPSIAGVAILWTKEGWAVQEADRERQMQSFGAAFGKPPKSYYRIRPCKFFAEGFCPNGKLCSFQHVRSKPASPSPPSEPEVATPGEKKVGFTPSPRMEDTRKLHRNHKTQPCKFFNSAGGCTNGDDCAFLHETVLPVHAPVAPKPRPWRTRPCRHFQTATCIAGDQCQFAHVLDPLFRQTKPVHLRRDPLDPNVSPAKACSYWMKKGKCSFGDMCKYSHPPRRQRSMDDQPHLLPSAPVNLWPTSQMSQEPSEVGDEDDDESSDDDVEIEINPLAVGPITT